MVKKYYLFIIFLYLNTLLFAIDFTNRFLVANVDGGYCYILIYKDKITFINMINNNINKILNMDSPENSDAFVCGNYFVIKARSRYSFYLLSNILKGQDGDNLDNFYKRPGNFYYDNIENIYLFNNDIYYTKINDKNYYRINSNEDGKVILISNVSSRKQIIYTPITSKKEEEFLTKGRSINIQYSKYNDLLKINDDKIRLKNIENNILKLFPKQPQNIDLIYNYLKQNEFENTYKYNSVEFENYILLSQFTDKIKEKDDIINQFNVIAPSKSPDDEIKNLYAADLELSNITAANYLENLLNGIKTNRDTKVISLKNEWGINYEDKYKKLNETNNKSTLEFEWKERTRENEFKNKCDRTKQLNDLIISTFKGSIHEKTNWYAEYLLLNNIFNDILFKYNNNKIKSLIIENIVADLGIEINSRQRYYIENYIKISNNVYLEVLKLDKEYEVERSNYNTKKNDLINKKEIAVKNIVKYCIDKYRYEISSDIKNKNNTLKLDFKKDYRDYSIINESKDDKWINGFKINEEIKWPANYFHNLGIGKTFISPVKNGIFIAISDTKLKAYNTSRPDITIPNIPAITINEGISYLVENSYSSAENYQYLVTKNGKLLKYSIDSINNLIKTEIISQNVNIDDKIIVTDDRAYVISTDGKINGIAGGDILVKPSNSNDQAKLLRVKDLEYIIP